MVNSLKKVLKIKKLKKPNQAKQHLRILQELADGIVIPIQPIQGMEKKPGELDTIISNL